MTSINTSWKMKATQLENHGRKGLGANNSILPQRLNRNPAVTFYQEADANDEVQEPQNQASWAELASGLQRSPALLPCEHQSWPGGLPAGLDPCPQGMCPLGRGQFPIGFQGLLLPVAPRVLCPTELRPATKHCPDSRREQRASPIIFLIFIAYLPIFHMKKPEALRGDKICWRLLSRRGSWGSESDHPDFTVHILHLFLIFTYIYSLTHLRIRI